MEIFINESSLHGQYNQQSIVEAVNSFLSVVRLLNETPRQKTIYKSPTIFLCQAINGQHLNSILAQNFELKTRFLLNLKNAVNWTADQKHSVNSTYVHNLVNYVSCSIAEIAERKLIGENFIGVLLNFADSQFNNDVELQLLKDGNHSINVACGFNEDTILAWLVAVGVVNPNENYDVKSKYPPRDFQTVLRNAALFTRTNEKNQGRRVYQRNGTDELWVVDNLHFGTDAHIEVFDSSTRRHLGISSISQVNVDTRYRIEDRTI